MDTLAHCTASLWRARALERDPLPIYLIYATEQKAGGNDLMLALHAHPRVARAKRERTTAKFTAEIYAYFRDRPDFFGQSALLADTDANKTRASLEYL